MNTISSSQNTIDLYTQKNEKIAKALETTKSEQEKKEIQADSIEISQQALQSVGNAGITNRTNPLDDLVGAGTITQDQANAIQSAFQSVGKAIQSTGIYNNRPANPLDSLVSAGTITEDQQTAIKSAFEASMKTTKHHGKGPAAKALKDLVTSGTITQPQEDAVIKALQASMKANRVNSKESNASIPNPLDSLVSEGTITQTQSDSILKALEESIKSNITNSDKPNNSVTTPLSL
ncbi:hypothetical protein G9F71_009575 [Clostridium sp. FP2]|uniref:hypothetical protein n=1 Tax=Clostridium sp. FP2 TaxID=2724481 RepID=UPI0013E92790|nr:hypothetical protein [Clostridium sp. FP2]MBZ9623105.1 hypothetical protein [Clostridium sp. FP2]